MAGAGVLDEAALKQEVEAKSTFHRGGASDEEAASLVVLRRQDEGTVDHRKRYDGIRKGNHIREDTHRLHLVW